MNHGARTHALNSASVIHRRFACPGSAKREAMAAPRPSSPYAAEGTFAHECLEYHLRNGHWPLNMPADVAVNLDGVVAYVEEIMDGLPGAEMLLEQKLRIPSDADGDVYGTGDILIYHPLFRVLYVIDLKYGMNPVEVEENTQLLFYGLGAVLACEGPVDDVVMVIAQPRAYHPRGPIREWRTDLRRVMDFYLELEACIEATLADDAPLVPSASACRYCAAAISDAGMCPAKESQALAIAGSHFTDVRQVYAGVLPPPVAMPLDKLAYTLAMADDLIDWLEECGKYAKELALHGHLIPGRKLVIPQARRSFDAEPETVAGELSLLFGLDMDSIMPRKLVGLTEIDRLVKEAAQDGVKGKRARQDAARAAKEIVATMTTKQAPAGTYSLVAENDPRPAVNPADAFQHVQFQEIQP